jgi:hypothetical protein
MNALIIFRSMAAGIVVSGFLFHSALAQMTVSNIFNYQVIPRTSLTTADFAAAGACKNTTSKIEIYLTRQDQDSVVPTFEWKDVAATVTGTSWSATITGLPVGGEYIAQFRSLNAQGAALDSSAGIHNLLVGDVWLAAGQSNMEQAAGKNLDAKHVHVRCLWFGSGATPYSGNDTSHWSSDTLWGPCMSFGAKLYSLTGVPVGILFSAAGGTSINDWFAPPQRPLFSMTQRLMNSACKFKINGFLWYQGENEDQQDTWASRYFVKFKPLRDTVRLLANNPNLPVLAVQLESWDGGGKYALAQERWPRWPIIRDQQEFIGSADAYSATISAVDTKGLHVESADQAKIGQRAAAAAAAISFGKNIGYGPHFQTAWFQDSTRSKIVVQFRGVKGDLVIPADDDHLGFFVMQPKLFDINDSAIFRYGANTKMLKNIKSVTTIDKDKAVIELTAAPAAAESLTVGYGRNINLITLNPLTDSTGIPVATFFNRPIAKTAPVGVGRNFTCRKLRGAEFGLAIFPVRGSKEMTFGFNLHQPSLVCLAVFSLNGKRVCIIKNEVMAPGRHAVRLNVHAVSLSNGSYICRMTAVGRETAVPFYVCR